MAARQQPGPVSEYTWRAGMNVHLNVMTKLLGEEV
jgi:hypothetical protein